MYNNLNCVTFFRYVFNTIRFLKTSSIYLEVKPYVFYYNILFIAITGSYFTSFFFYLILIFFLLSFYRNYETLETCNNNKFF